MKSERSKKRYQRIDENGKPYRRANVCGQFPRVQRFCRDVGEAIATNYGHHPALWAAEINTEARDGTEVCFHNHDRKAYQRFSGLDYPVKYLHLSKEELCKSIPPNGVVSYDHPLLVFRRWFWKTGDGWNLLHAKTHQGIKSTEGGENVLTFFDPAVRAPALWGSCRELDAISHWSYTYPDPLRLALATDELLAMADGAPGQKVLKMTQVIWYRDQVAPRNRKTPKHQAEWEKKEPDAGFITCAPDHLREAFWLKISRPVNGILYYGPGCLVGGGKAQRMTNPETRKTLKRLIKTVIIPLGPTLSQLPDAAHSVVMLESFTSMVFGSEPTWGWARGWAGDVYQMLQWARLQPKVIYEETILRDDLKGVNVLVMPDCPVLPANVSQKILNYQQRGGLVIGDINLAPAITPDILIDRQHRSTCTPPDKFKIFLQKQAEYLRTKLMPVYRSSVDSSSPDVLVRNRTYKDTDYLFAVNDKRTFGDYVGHHRKVMEKGLPNQAELLIKRKNVYIYDLLENCMIKTEETKDGTKWSVTLKSCGGRLFMISPKPIAEVSVKTASRSSDDRMVKIITTVSDNENKLLSAIIPVEIRIFDPNGNEAEFSGYYGAKDGIQIVNLDLAANDEPGTWTITARELATGKTAQTEFEYVKNK